MKAKLQAGETVIGPFVIVPSMTLIDTLGHAGVDFCIIDAEHGPISMETAADLVIAADGAGVSPIIRVGDNDERLILRALDIGSAGVEVPQINNPDDARKLVHAAKYSPIGERGLSIF
ncbi:MAG: aldolase/citrate lyase family protein, partial [Chloroflexi bacterium]|nr:aldolase/citrate lyase family protein [Chloroflexota bacterium]